MKALNSLAIAAVGLLVAAVALAAAPAPSTAPSTGPAQAPGAGGRFGGRGGFGGGGFGGGGGRFGGGGARGSILDQVHIQGSGAATDKSMIAHEQNLTKAKIGKGKIDVYVEGDSIMRRWGCDPEVEPTWAASYATWKNTFWGYNAGDFAWGADTIQNILWRLRNGELDDLNPKVVVFLGGTNNVNPNANVDDLTKGLTACFDEIHKKAPDATLVIIGVLPRMPAGDIPVIDKINENLSKLADGKKTRFIDLKDKFYKDGQIIPGMLLNDNLHPQPKGFQTIGDSLKPILKEVLGPPAADDHAPPPTWDPSAKGAPATYPKPK